MPTFQTPLSPELERQARRRAGQQTGWLVHATVFALVNAALWLAGHRGGWLGLPTGGWLIGLLIHGAVVWLRPQGQHLHQHLLTRERRRLAGQEARRLP
ncbi:2TM domain-containing protein [Hydrogenophaga taeniospiralis]|uniref:2TM domain-containing protein n=1 Tax=Hydrogenophaga taeniospiralis TaxID=65656 RepID=UPI0008B90C21|nr:2TM domain-containing protein [Hydrogenophaga taeniospiralis]MCB4366320.1 2TM domain-containing protein [Hydrogenophaga taeniospiralis]OGB15586.1 MAG: hypothetical protein A3I64_02340 [Burkholderiales bacterium RIFCSPLOWO2_02_FULL_67_64]OGB51286.1 MAG: hypothetical protein A3E51_00290 [Burkholderiales bacterium RIFCSPHIGHO2_12_FULL_67_38]OGB77228.1 MAG: hypothetical protein A3G82_26070 [Burkholderiales bacterium RIFCSPLOWO2_12_FULL_67_210]